MKVFIFPICRTPNYAERFSGPQLHRRALYRAIRHSPGRGIAPFMPHAA